MKILYRVLIIVSVFALPPYIWAGSSIFGLGPRLIGEYRYAFSTAELGRGGVAIAFSDSLGINRLNFAHWHALTRSTFSLDLQYKNLSSEINNTSISSSDANFGGGFLVLPLIAKRFAVGFGLVPYAQNDIQVRVDSEDTGSFPSQNFSVKGNISQAHLAAAFSMTDQFSLALSGNFMFGLIADKLNLEYAGSGFANTEIENNFQLYGPGFGIDAYYQFTERIGAGLVLRSPTQLTLFTEQTSISQTSTVEKDREMSTPLQLGAGLSYRPSSRWILGFDYQYQAWETGYKIDDEKIEGMSNSFRIALGAERLPSSRRFTSYSDVITWRFGVFMGNMNVLVNNKEVSEIGLGVGIGLPIAKNRNRLDISLEFGKRGSLDTNQQSEMYFLLNFAFTTNELWFVREER